MAKVYYENNADLSVLDGKKVGIIGFGNQGRAQAMNLKDGGIDVCIGMREDSKSGSLIEERGLQCQNISGTVTNSDIIVLLVPDQIMGQIYEAHVSSYIKEGQTLIFSHGYNIHYNVILPSKNINVVMAAPSGAGTELRKRYKEGGGIPGLFAIHQDYTGNSKQLILAYCKAIGLTRMGVFESTFKEETGKRVSGSYVIISGASG